MSDSVRPIESLGKDEWNHKRYYHDPLRFYHNTNFNSNSGFDSNSGDDMIPYPESRRELDRLQKTFKMRFLKFCAWVDSWALSKEK